MYFDILDALGMLHNAAYLLLFERARFDLWRVLGVTLDKEHFDWPYYVAHNEVDYKAPILSAQDITVTMALRALGRSSLTFAHEVYRREGVLSAVGGRGIVRLAGRFCVPCHGPRASVPS